jgi:hypothetical protein
MRVALLAAREVFQIQNRSHLVPELHLSLPGSAESESQLSAFEANSLLTYRRLIGAISGIAEQTPPNHNTCEQSYQSFEGRCEQGYQS